MTVLIGADAVGRLEVTDEARGGKRVARLQEHLPHLPVVWPGVEEPARSLGKHGPACGGQEGERQTQLVVARSRPLVDPARQLAAVDAQPAHRLLKTHPVHTARAGLKLVEEGVNVVTPASLALDVVEAALKPRDDEVEAEALNPPQR